MGFAKYIKISNGLNWLINPKTISPALGRSNNAALSILAPIIIDDTEHFVPMRTGQLRQSAYKNIELTGRRAYTDAQLSINYSRRIKHFTENTASGGVDTKEGAPDLYHGKNPIRGNYISDENWTTPGTGGYWIKKSIEENSDRWVKQFGSNYVEMFRRNLGLF